ncbi:hypothetical protein ACFOQM_05280 [Paenibacillus sp. GCM10012307]|uniref:Uncharacterized protein n=1 Tax=Paenibacillus roseus TaxID=2798579 RepID=A0A934J5J0_9BACL|nr:hypothetical protein [Paenibacillus roseus]MBJ6360718.1 hypothetical protein [Paenibacillus roseus]
MMLNVSRITSKVFKMLLVAAISVLMVLFTGLPKTGAAAGDSWGQALSSLDSLYDSFIKLESEVKLDKQNIQALKTQNNEQLKSVNEKLRTIGKAQIGRLQETVDLTVKKHGPLLVQYAELGSQLAEATKRKDQKAAALLKLKHSRLKSPVEAAKAEIKQKKQLLAAARKQATAQVRDIKDTLGPVHNLKGQTSEENKLAIEAGRRLSEASKRHRSAIKEGDAVSAAAELAAMYAELGKIHASQQRILSYEKQSVKLLATAVHKLNSLGLQV